MKQFFPAGASGWLARLVARWAAAREPRPGPQLCHMVGMGTDGPSCSGFPAARPRPLIIQPQALMPLHQFGVLRKHHVSSMRREGCDGQKKMDVCFLPYLICFAYICMPARDPFTLRIPFVSCRSFASQSWRVCMRVWREIQDSSLCDRNYM